MNRPHAAMLLCAAAALLPRAASGSYGVYVGKDLTASGHVLIGGTGEEVSSHWLEVVPRTEHAEGATITAGVTAEANIPGELIEIPQVRETARYISMFYSEFKGFPPPLSNGGLSEHGVAVRDIWSPSRAELVEMTPTPQRGLSYSDLSRIVLERARTARQGVEIIGELIAEHGYATYGGNSHLIADADEGWVVIQLAGGQGLWVAERLGPDDIRVSYPGYIGAIPADYLEHPDYMGSPHLIEFAEAQGWYDRSSGEPFDVHQVYGQQGVAMGNSYKLMSATELEDELRALAPDIGVRDVMAWVRDPRIANEEAGYGQVAELRDDVLPDLRLLWVAPTGSVTAPFIPYRIGVRRALPEFGQHRYLTKGAARTFLSPDYQAQEATVFAGRVFKRLMYYTCDRPERFLPEVTEALEAFEARMLAEQPRIEAEAAALYGAGRPALARDLLTRYSDAQAMEGLRLGEALLASIEARTKVLFGVREPVTGEINEAPVAGRDTISCITSVDSDDLVLGATEPDRRRIEIASAPPPAPESPRSGTSWLALGLAFALGLAPGGATLLARRRRGATPGS